MKVTKKGYGTHFFYKDLNQQVRALVSFCFCRMSVVNGGIIFLIDNF